MKKKLIAVIAGVFLMGSLTGCSSQLSNEYITIKQYKGLEVPQVEATELTDDQVDELCELFLQADATRTEVTDRAAQTGDTVNIDYVGKQQLKNLLKQFGNGVQLRPTYLVSSGKGVHAYYFLKEPVQLYHNLEDTLAELKEAFIRRLWNDTSSIRPDSPDITGIYQALGVLGARASWGQTSQ